MTRPTKIPERTMRIRTRKTYRLTITEVTDRMAPPLGIGVAPLTETIERVVYQATASFRPSLAQLAELLDRAKS